MEFTKSEAKQWAKEHYKGIDGNVSPSFSPDLEQLDEEGIRHDVRLNINRGFFSVFCQTEVVSMTMEERKRFVEIVCDEAKGKVIVSMFTGIDTTEKDIELLQHFEKVGGTHTLLGWPGMFHARSEEDIYTVTKRVCDATNLAVDLWPKPKFDFGRFHKSQFNPELIERITDIPNVVSVKAYISDGIGKWADVQHRVGDKILLEAAEIEEWPITVAHFNQQWAGPADYIIFDQSSDNPRIVKMFNLFSQGNFSEAMAIYWELAPITIDARVAMFQSGMMGVKYMQWLTGGNGGMYRQPAEPMFQRQKDAMRAGLRAAGISPAENEEEFYVGKLNYAKGMRLKYK